MVNLQFMKEWTDEEKDKKKYTELFGAPHFLRLFSKLMKDTH